MVDFEIPKSGFDRVTYAVRNLPVANLVLVNEKSGVDYPISGDTLGRS